jgi:hypothetical protein
MGLPAYLQIDRSVSEVRMHQSTDTSSTPSTAARVTFIRSLAFLTALFALLLFPASASASLLSPEMEDKLADILAVVVIFLVPVIGIVVFWLLHIMPEKIAHKRHHPQFEAIRTLCLLSLAFGGLLWPLAWLWAYTKPVGYKLAYGTDKHPDYYKEHGLPDPHDDNGPAIGERTEPVV